MNGWSTHTGDALSLPMDNIDTDQLIPARFMSQPRTAGYADFLLHDIRRDAPVSIDIESGQLQCESLAIDFYLEDSLQHKLLNGWDDIDLTLNHIDQIAAFRTRRFANHAWALPASTTNTQSN